MKRNNLVTAVLAGIAGVAGIAGSAQAINVNPDGLGQVLIYPYYTVNNGNMTLLSVVNTTDYAKAVKVRFLESLNSREVLDFNLYLSQWDVWTAAIMDVAGTPTLLTADSSCTVPYFYGNSGANKLGVQPFLNFAYSGLDTDGGPSSISRAAEGHFEIIEMGQMYGSSAAAATHVQPGAGPNTQVPSDCEELVTAWRPGSLSAYWLADSSIDITAATGGLFGGAALIDTAEGAMYSYNAKALNAFWDVTIPAGNRHTNPGSELPSLAQGGDLDANIFFDNGAAATLSYINSIDAVSALFMHDNVMNEYSTAPVLSARSEWVVTFPTKRFYVDPAFAVSTPPVEPFTEAMAAALACEVITLRFWDREEGEPHEEGDVIVSPAPPPGEIPVFELCAETNVVRFQEADELGAVVDAAPIVGVDNDFGSLVKLTLPHDYTSGWARFDMANYIDGFNVAQVRNDGYLQGLPVTGFWLEAFSNTGVGEGAFYGALYEHRATRAQYFGVLN